MLSFLPLVVTQLKTQKYRNTQPRCPVSKISVGLKEPMPKVMSL
jgi:hypothetical protein